MASFQTLSTFIDTAVRSRKYPEATGIALKVALKLFENELNEEERGSLEVFKSHFEQIYRSVCQKNSTRFNMGTLATYRSRITRVLQDYDKYGVDPTKMANWNPKIRVVRKKPNLTQTITVNENSDEKGENEEKPLFISDSVNKYSFMDSGNGWQLSIKSKSPLTLSMKIALIEVFKNFEVTEEKDEQQ